MADWSQLPGDILQEIITRLNSPIYTVRLRSICSNWRDAITSNGPNQTPHSLSLSTNSTFNHLSFSLSKRSIILLSPPPTFDSPILRPWIIKLEEINPNCFNLFYPFSKTRINPLPDCFPEVLNLLNIRIYELGVEFSIRRAGILGDCSLYTEKIAILPGKNGGHNDFLLLTIHVSGKLAIFNNVDMKWTLVDRFQSPYDDIIAYNGEFYAVDNLGRAVVLIDNSVSVVAEPVCGGDKKRLVEMCGELMLVDIYIGLPPLYDDGYEEGDDYGDVIFNSIHMDRLFKSRSIWFHVYRLDREGTKWVEVKDLGNFVLFLGVNSTFAASADDLSWDKGNCICFNVADLYSQSHEAEDDHVLKYHFDGVYKLEDSSISSSTLFWPPPSWINSTS